MGAQSLCRRVLLGFLLSLFVAGLCYGTDESTVRVVGFGECADCKENNIKTSQAFSGIPYLSDL